MNIMPDANTAGSEVEVTTPGSPATDPASTSNPAGQSEEKGQGGEVTPEMYKSLETKMGEMGQELGGYREFVQSITPLLEKLDASPQLVQAIIDGKIDSDLAQAVADGKVTIGDAAVVTEAAKEVEKVL